MFNLHCSIGNPWRKDDFENLYNRAGGFGKHKAWEFEIIRHSENLVEFNIGWSIMTDHAGPSINIGLFGYNVEFQIYDTRHWDYKNNQWEVYEEQQTN